VAEQSFRNVEVIIVDQNPSGFLDDIILAYQGFFPLIHVLSQTANASTARNIGIAHAKGDVIAFPDDDCLYAPGVIQRVVDELEANTHWSGLLVSWAQSPKKPRHPGRVDRVTRWTAFRRAGTLVQFYRASAINGILFDPALGPGENSKYGSGEDTSFLLSVLSKKMYVAKIHDVLVYHLEPDFSNPDMFHRVRSYALGRMRLLRKHKFPLWFKLANVFYPLLHIPFCGRDAVPYHKAMFVERWKGFWDKE
jgi:glycosyltransferase involved in cell wall biosynthesis